MYAEDDATNGARCERDGRTYETLPRQARDAVAGWPTPCATDWKGSTEPGQRRGQLSEAVSHRWPTPTANEATGYMSGTDSDTWRPSLKGAALGAKPCRGRPDPTTPTDGASTSTAGRVLNPRFVEALMGWPDGWTDCASWETESSPTKQPSPSEPCGAV
jgi:hypothetical protein